MTSLAEIWGSLEKAGKPTPYMLIDCAGIDGGEFRIPREAFSELECLFTGDLAVELANVGPYLGRVKSYAPDVKAVVEELLSEQVALLVTLQDLKDEQENIAFSEVHRHFRKFNVVYGPEGDPLFFRYYDPRVLLDVLTALDGTQLEAFFGPTDTLVFLDRSSQVTRCYRQAGKLLVSV